MHIQNIEYGPCWLFCNSDDDDDDSGEENSELLNFSYLSLALFAWRLSFSRCALASGSSSSSSALEQQLRNNNTRLITWQLFNTLFLLFFFYFSFFDLNLSSMAYRDSTVSKSRSSDFRFNFFLDGSSDDGTHAGSRPVFFVVN